MAVVSNVPTFGSFQCVQVSGGQLRVALRVTVGLYGPPDVRGVDTTIPSKVGQTPQARVAHGRTILLEGPAQGVGSSHAAQMSDFVALMRELETAFDPTADPAVLSVVIEDGSTVTINARTVNWLGPEVDPIPGRRDLSIELYSTDPDWA